MKAFFCILLFFCCSWSSMATEKSYLNEEGHIVFHDNVFETKVRLALRIPVGTPVTLKDAESMDRLDLSAKPRNKAHKVRDIGAIQYFKYLRELNIRYTEVHDLSPLNQLQELRKLDCWYTSVRDISPLAGMTFLKDLNLGYSRVTDLCPLEGLEELETLWLAGLRFRDFSCFEKINPELKSLSMMDCGLKEIDFLKGFNPHYLMLSRNKIRNIDALAAMTQLRQLNLSQNKVKDIRVLKELSENGAFKGRRKYGDKTHNQSYHLDLQDNDLDFSYNREQFEIIKSIEQKGIEVMR